MSKTGRKKSPGENFAVNRMARHRYSLGESFNAGLALEGWEVKSLRARRCQLRDSYVRLDKGEAWLMGVHIDPLPNVGAHRTPLPDRTRKLLLRKRELASLTGSIAQKGFTCVATRIYPKGHLIKCEIALAKGKKLHDKRETEKTRDWQRQQQRLMRNEALR